MLNNLTFALRILIAYSVLCTLAVAAAFGLLTILSNLCFGGACAGERWTIDGRIPVAFWSSMILIPLGAIVACPTAAERRRMQVAMLADAAQRNAAAT